MAIEIKESEEDIWVKFAAAAMNGLLAGPANVNGVAYEASGFADDLVLEHRKRFARKPPAPEST